MEPIGRGERGDHVTSVLDRETNAPAGVPAAAPVDSPSLASWVGALVVAVLPGAVLLAYDPGGWFPFGPATWLVVATLVPVGVAATLLGPVRIERSFLAWWAVLLGALAVAVAVGLDDAFAWIGTPERRLGWLTWLLFAGAFLTGRNVAPASARRVVPWSLTIATLGVGGVAAAQALGWRSGAMALADGRLGATLGSPAYLGQASVLLVPASLGIALDRTVGTTLRRGASVAAVVGTVALIGSGTRGSWLGGAVALLVVVALHRSTLRANVRTTLVVAGAVAVVLVAVLAWTPAGGRLDGLRHGSGGGGGVGRVDEWRVAGRVLADHPVLGVGPEGYRIAFAAGVDASYERAHGRDPLPDRAHSAPLDVALAGGPIALVAWLGLAFLVGRRCLRALRRGPVWLAGLAAGILAAWVGTLVLFPTMELDLVWWLLAGVVVAATAGGGGAVATAPSRGPGRIVTVTVAVVVAGLGVALVGSSVTAIRADRDAAASVAASRRGDVTAARDHAADAVALEPAWARYRLLLGDADRAAGRGDTAALADLGGGDDEPDPILRRYRAALLVDRAATTLAPPYVAAARSAVDRLLADDPNLAEAHLLDGRLAAAEGRPAAALVAWRTAADLAPRSVDALVLAVRLQIAEGDRSAATATLVEARRRAPEDPAVRTLTRELGR
jgi:O-antigen ligase